MKLRCGFIAGFFLMIFALYPQLKLWYLRGYEWQGHYAYNDIDEVAYAAYLKALIDGRPRLNDPYTNRDDLFEKTREESLFSIQFAAPYTIAIPSRILGFSAPTAMWLSGAIAAFLTGLILFWVLNLMLKDELFAMAGAILVISTGALAAGEGAIGEILEIGFPYPYFPGFRRYVPALALVAFFLTVTFAWLTITKSQLQEKLIFCTLASLGFAYCVFSYFYIWTTAFAWFFCLALVWLIARPTNWLQDFRVFLVLLFICSIWLIPYAILLSRRSHTLDQVQLLVFTREPDLMRLPELICFFLILVLLLLALLRVVNLRDRLVLFTFSLLLVPPITFNQQLITGRVLQPIHYQVFIGNYVTTFAFVLILGIVWTWLRQNQKNLAFRSAPLFLTFFGVFWGLVECHYTVKPLDEANVWRDEAFAVGKRLAEIAKVEGRKKVIFAPDLIQGDDMPTLAPQTLLWARHQHIFPGVTWQENKERYYQHLYFQGIDKEDLIYRIVDGDYVSIIALFGWGRHTDRLNPKYKPLTYQEVYEEAEKFEEYTKSFHPERSPDTILSYLVVPADWEINFDNLDRWYERSEPEVYGKYLLYRLSLKE
ncbi:MAG: hypothetical protein N2Z23_08845 [Pyrinomonadaceae bacterium]|nr:hypothetical protein [Pyrinomonadaceae bacterium]MCX7640528.1 hypothetical protein [Pyrinomonadaceae bacterium]MDW8303891.1 hypothetical protein [Acidobacteriota bacterium]